MVGRVEGKVALITGAASGIGRACAERLAEEGAVVVITDLQQAAGEEAVATLQASGKQSCFLRHDVSAETEWQAVVAEIEARFGALHILVNNAGVGIGGSILELSLEDWRRQQAVNLDGVFLGVKHSVPLIRASGGGSIINVSSVAGMRGSPNLAAYCATKGGVRLFTKGVALESAQKGWQVRLNSIHPGVIDTPIWQKVNPEFLDDGANAVDLAAMATTVPLGTIGQPRDIAEGVLYLASDESRYVTGTELVIDGGLCA